MDKKKIRNFDRETEIIVMNSEMESEEDDDNYNEQTLLEQPIRIEEFVKRSLQDEHFRKLLRENGWVDVVQLEKDEKNTKYKNKFYHKDPYNHSSPLWEIPMDLLESDKKYRINIFKSFIHGNLEVVRGIDFEASLSEDLRKELSQLRKEIEQREKEKKEKREAEAGEKEAKKKSRAVARAKKLLEEAGEL